VTGLKSIIADEPRIANMHSGGNLAKIEDALVSVREMEPSRAGVRALVSRVETEPRKVTVFASRTALGEVLGMPSSLRTLRYVTRCLSAFEQSVCLASTSTGMLVRIWSRRHEYAA
jgi:hypothetical protein